MDAIIDHIVLWVQDPIASLRFYEQTVGFPGVRVEEYKAGEAPFLSVRVSSETIIDLMSYSSAAGTEKLTRAPGSAAHPVNHLCLALTKPEYDELAIRLEKESVDTHARLHQSFGARGLAPETFYFKDPDGNVIEARYYLP
ncbi:MAG TPA: VOC family protein [Streptosporangiaceae bacterium]|jgi:catechol 2,3-dioxygenase-like lactoylglutathione lyase family enzyme